MRCGAVTGSHARGRKVAVEGGGMRACGSPLLPDTWGCLLQRTTAAVAVVRGGWGTHTIQARYI